MSLGVLNGTGESPPGTVVLYEQEQDLNTAFSAYKHGSGKVRLSSKEVL